MLADGGFVEMTERVLEVQGTLKMIKYLITGRTAMEY